MEIVIKLTDALRTGSEYFSVEDSCFSVILPVERIRFANMMPPIPGLLKLEEALDGGFPQFFI